MSRKYASQAGLVLSVVMCGCQATTPFETQWPETRPLAGDYPTARDALSDGNEHSVGRNDIEPVGQLTLDDSLRLTLAHHPALASFAWELRARDAQAEQAGYWSNPELAFEIENFAGSGDASGFDAADTTISIGQVIPGGDRIEKAVRAAEQYRDLAGWDYEAARIQAASTTASRFLDVLVAQRRIVVAQGNLELADRVADIATRRVEAGDVPPSESIRATLTSSEARISHAQAKLNLETARRTLVNQWGGTLPQFSSAQGDLESLHPIPALDDLLDQLQQHPEVARWATETSWRRARLVLAEALAKPDFTLEGGLRHLGDSDDVALVALLSVPLTLNDRNQGGIREARAELLKTEHDRRLMENGLQLALLQVHGDLQSAHLEATVLRDEALPAARSVSDAINRAYEQGQIGWVEVIDAQRTLMNLQSRYLEALASYHRAVVQIEGLIGRPLASVDDSSNSNTPSFSDGNES